MRDQGIEVGTLTSARLAAHAPCSIFRSSRSHDSISTTAVTAALEELRAFPRMSATGKGFAARADLIIRLREAIKKADWNESGSWGPLCDFLDQIPADMRDDGEVRSAHREATDKRKETEDTLRNALAGGRSVRAATADSGGQQVLQRRTSSATRRSIGGGGSAGGGKRLSRVGSGLAPASAQVNVTAWNHDVISTEGVAAALQQLRAYPRRSEEGEALGTLAQQIIELRNLLRAATWESNLRDSQPACAGWAALAKWLERAANSPNASEDEVRAAMQELSDRRALVCNGVHKALSSGRSVLLQKGTAWSHETIDVKELQESSAELAALVRLLDQSSSDAENALVDLSALIISLRQTLRACDWSDAATWAGLANFLEKIEKPELRDCDEVQSAWREFEAKRADTENVTKAALETGRSVRVSAEKWMHDKIVTEPLSAAIAELEAFPRISDVGKGLAAHGHLILSLRKALLTCDWGVAKSWTGLADLLDGVPHEYDELPEVLTTKQELTEKRIAVEAATQLALDTGCSVRVGEGEWSHETITVDTLKLWLTELEAFPRMSDAGKVLTARSHLAVRLREALRVADSSDAASWKAVDDVLMSSPPTADERNGVGGFEELLNARIEFDDMREATEQGLIDELDVGHATRVGAPLPDGASCEAIAASWDHTAIATEALQSAIAEVEAFPRGSEFGASLANRGRVALAVREALAEATFRSAASWTDLLGALELASRVLSADDLAAFDELGDAQDELNDARCYMEQAVREAMADGGSVRQAEFQWSHDSIQVEPLKRALAELTGFPNVARARRMTMDNVTGLAPEAKQVLVVRKALMQCQWDEAASWKGLVRVLDAMPPELPDIDEIVAARSELLEKQQQTVEAVRTALAKGGSVRRMDGKPWDHASISTEALDQAVAECEAFPKPHVESASLIARARTVIGLRKVLIATDPKSPPTWKPVVSFLQNLKDAEDLALPEVKATWREFKEAKEAATSAVNTALTDGCSRPGVGGGLKPWDHSKIDAEGLIRAALHLESFPVIDAAAVGSGAPARGGALGSNGADKPAPRLSTRTSLVLKSETSNSLVSAAKAVSKLREMLLAEAWSDVQKTLSAGAGDMPGPATDEYRRASQELQNMASLLESELSAALESNRSVPKTADLPASPPGKLTTRASKGGSLLQRMSSVGSARVKSVKKSGSVKDVPRATGKWDHADLSVDYLADAVSNLLDFPLQGANAKALLKQAELVSVLREQLLACNWLGLTKLLADISDVELQQLDEVRAAGQELEDARIAVEAELTSSLASGRSLKVIGAKKVVHATKSYWVPIEWDHSGLEAGTRRLQRAVDAAEAFPSPLDGAKELYATAAIALRLRKLVFEHKWVELGEALEAITSLAEQRLDEVINAWQEYLCWELERATKALDQPTLKAALARATGVGMQPFEKPVDRALAVFIDPPEFVVDMHDGDVFPSADGTLVLRVKVRGATTLHWVKNEIALREGADGGRILGVTTPQLTFTHLLGRDADQKVWCIAQNKWGTVRSKQVTLRTEARQTPLTPGQAQTPSMGSAKMIGSARLIGNASAEPPKDDGAGDGSPVKTGHKKRFSLTLGALVGRPSSTDKPVSGVSGRGSSMARDEEETIPEEGEQLWERSRQYTNNI